MRWDVSACNTSKNHSTKNLLWIMACKANFVRPIDRVNRRIPSSPFRKHAFGGAARFFAEHKVAAEDFSRGLARWLFNLDALEDIEVTGNRINLKLQWCLKIECCYLWLINLELIQIKITSLPHRFIFNGSRIIFCASTIQTPISN